jgi:predicted metal-dependent peptidase
MYLPYKKIKLNPEGLRRWSNTKTRFQWSVPAFTHLLYKMLNPDDHDQIALFTRDVPTLATDGRRLIVNPEYLFGLTDKQQVFAVCHEVEHAMYMHPLSTYVHMTQQLPVLWQGKSLPFHPKIANYARDYCINAELVAAKIGEIHPSWLYDEKIAVSGTCWQEAYHRIFEECEAASGGARSEPGKGEQAKQEGSGGDQLPQDPSDQDTTGANPRMEAGQFDKHLPPGASDQKEPHDSSMQPDPQRWQQAIAGAITVGQAAGTMPASLLKQFETLLKPNVPWQDHIQGLLRRKVNGSGYDFRRLDRRLITRGIGAPGKSGHGCGTVVVGADSSGSIYAVPQLIERVFAEVAGMLEELNPRQLVVMWCDAEVQRVDVIEDPQDLAECYYKGASGGGGTRFMPVFEKIDELELEDVDAVVYLTDNENSDRDALAAMGAPEYPVIWAILEGDYPEEVPFGDVVRIPTDGSA